MRKSGLGKGLDALLDNNDELEDTQYVEVEIDDISPIKTQDTAPLTAPQFAASQQTAPQQTASTQTASLLTAVQLPVEKLVPNPGQPRKNFDETELKELADSIKTYGIIQPVIVADAGDDSYIIVAGERRTRAAKLAGLNTVPAIIRDYTDQKRLEISLIENIQRSGLNPIEEAAAFKNLIDFSGISQDELAARIGKNRSTIANALRLLKLPVEIQKSIEEGKVSSGHARTLLSVDNTRAREKLYRDILAGNFSVREAERRASALNVETTSSKNKTAENGSAKKSKKRPPEIDAMIEKFIRRLGTKVVIDGDLNKGKIHIDYYSMEDLERLYEILG